MQKSDITAVILAGGRGLRMGGVDKGLQLFNGVPLALHTLRRLAPQVGSVRINANRNLTTYEEFGVPVYPDAADLGDYAGPLAGFMTGLQRCTTSYLLTVPCDTPLFPHDLAVRLANTLTEQSADFAVASAREEDGKTRAQPVFCLMGTHMLPSLTRFMQTGGRKIDAWTAQHRVAHVPFNVSSSVPSDVPSGLSSDHPQAFFNANTLAELQQLEARTD